MIQTQIIRRAIDPAAVAAALGGPATRPPGLVTRPISLVTPPPPAAVPTEETPPEPTPETMPEPSPAPSAPKKRGK